MVALLFGVLTVAGCTQLPDAVNPVAWYRGVFGAPAKAQNPQTEAAVASIPTVARTSAAPRRTPSLAEKSAVPSVASVAAKPRQGTTSSSPFDVERLFDKLFTASGPRGRALETPIAFTPPNPDPALEVDPAASPSASAQSLLEAGPSEQGEVGEGASLRSREAVIVHFAVGSAALSPGGRRTLGKIAKLFRKHGGTVRVVGHASSRTRNLPIERHKMINFGISLDRAVRVTQALIKLGVDAEAIQTIADSDNDPRYHEWMPSGEAGNRRAEITIEY